MCAPAPGILINGLMANELTFSWQCKMDRLHDMKLHHSLPLVSPETLIICNLLMCLRAPLLTSSFASLQPLVKKTGSLV
jgi:hypothetical protein